MKTALAVPALDEVEEGDPGLAVGAEPVPMIGRCFAAARQANLQSELGYAATVDLRLRAAHGESIGR